MPRGWEVFIVFFLTATCLSAETIPFRLVDSLNREAWNAISVNKEKARTLAIQAFDAATTLQYDDGIALAYNRFGKILAEEGNLDSSLYNYRKNLKIRLAQKNYIGVANTFLNMGDVFVKKGDAAKAIRYYLAAQQLFSMQKDSLNMAIACLKRGILYNEQQKIKAAERTLLYGLSLTQEQERFSAAIAGITAELGNLYSSIGSEKNALHYYQYAAQLYGSMNDTRNLSNVLLGLGNVYANQHNYRGAIQAYQRSLHTYTTSGGVNGVALRMYNIGNVLSELGRSTEALHYLEHALTVAGSADALLAQKILYALSKVCYEVGQYEKSIHYDAGYDSVTNLLFNIEKEKQFNELEIQYEVREKQQEIRLLKATKELQVKSIEKRTLERNVWLAGALLFSLAGSIAYIAYRQKKKANAVLLAQKSVIETQHKEKEVLLREIHHRVKNNLQVVSSILSLQSYRVADKHVSIAMRESRARVEAMSMIHRELYRDEKLTHIYLPTYLKRLVEQVSRSYGFDETNLLADVEVFVEEVDVETAMPIGLIVNEVLSNTFKHAFKSQLKPQILLKMKREHGFLHLVISDNGIGFNSSLNEGTFGMDLIRSLTKQLKGTFTIDANEGTAYTFALHEHVRLKS